MIYYIRKKHGIQYAVIWLSDENDVLHPSCDVVEYVQSTSKRKLGCNFVSLYTDLTQDEDSLFSRIDKQTRYEIRRIAKDHPHSAYYGCREEIPQEHLKKFFDDYDDFATAKGLDRIDRDELLTMASQKILLLSTASLEEKVLASHTYVFDRNKARLLNSVSMFRNSVQVSSSKIGMLNRWLHWSDMQYLKQNNLNFLDWGGINYDNLEIANITKFKKEFGGIEWTSTSYSDTPSFKGTMYKFLLKLINNKGK
ncbi:MAG: hypothetical protein PHI85_04115 [Victivallaceae bacterium]|nr:hypothetical protein [Victivallaceae bacterium]